jgi:DNA repair protein RadA/Sms
MVDARYRPPPPPPPPPIVATVADAPDVPEVRLVTEQEGLDRVLGGGFVVPSVVLFAGPPGCGKSSLLLPMVANLPIGTALYGSTEEKPARVRRRALRFGLKDRLHRIQLVCSNQLPEILAKARALDARLVVVDSVNDAVDPRDDAKDPQERLKNMIYTLYEEAYAANRVMVLVSHLNKEEEVSGRRALQHKVDTILQIEKSGRLRKLHCPTKNRDGATETTAFYTMEEQGLRQLSDDELRSDAQERRDAAEIDAATLRAVDRPPPRRRARANHGNGV